MSPEAPRGGSGEMFDAIAQRYDLLNRVISLGIDQSWRRRTVRALGLTEQGDGATVLDLATGTGDLAVMTAKMFAKAKVIGLDPSAGMLAVAESKVKREALGDRITLTLGDAQALPFTSGLFDGVTMAFGIRNVPDRPRALAEMARVTKPGGRVAILELSNPKRGPFAAMASFHIHTVVPWLGSVLSGSREYRYLHESIEAFPSPESFAEMMKLSGLEVIEVVPLTFGVSCLYVATVRPELS